MCFAAVHESARARSGVSVRCQCLIAIGGGADIGRALRSCPLFPAILGLHLDKRATLVKDVSVLSSSWGAMKHEASRACSHYRLSNVISGWRCRATIRTIIREPAADLYPEPCCHDGINPSESF